MISPRQYTRAVLDELGVRPRKRLGQHFLIDPDVVQRMLDASGVGARDEVLEIGPGLGALTEALFHRAGRLDLVETDAKLAARLRARFASEERVRVLGADFLRLDVRETFPRPPVKVVASLPYNVATPILFRLLEHRARFPEATVMLQREVAERLTATPGTKAYGVLSVLVQLFAETTPAFDVPRQSFFPVPRVDSQVVRVVFQAAPRVPAADPAVFRRIVKAAFNQRRKTLRNALRPLGAAGLAEIGRRAGIDLQRRGETLALEEFAALANSWPTPAD